MLLYTMKFLYVVLCSILCLSFLIHWMRPFLQICQVWTLRILQHTSSLTLRIAVESRIRVLWDLRYWGAILSTSRRHSGCCSGVTVSLRSSNRPACFSAMGHHVAGEDYPHISAQHPSPLYVHHLALAVNLCNCFFVNNLGTDTFLNINNK